MYESALGRGTDGASLLDFLGTLATVGLDGDAADAELLAQLAALEQLKAAAAAAQARVTAAFAVSHERAATAARAAAKGAGFEAWQAARDAFRGTHGIAAQVALARRLSPSQGARAASSARALVDDLPATLAAMTAGALSEHRAGIVVRETSQLAPLDRSAVDQEVCGDVAALDTMGDRSLERAVRAAVYHRDPAGALDRSRAAARDRRVSVRPLPDAMCRVSALLPLAQGVGVYATLSRDADAARAAGDARTRGQVMADTLVERVTGRSRANGVAVELQVVLTDTALLGTGPGADDPAQVSGYGTVPAGWVRDLIGISRARGTCDADADADADAAQTRVWVRRLFATPDRSQLVAMESDRRLFPESMRRFLRARDGTCRTPWCDAPIRHFDHVGSSSSGGPTSTTNGEGLCERCNYTKELPGWKTAVVSGGRSPHTVRWTTPTGARYDSIAPPLLPGARHVVPRRLLSTVEATLTHRLAA